MQLTNPTQAGALISIEAQRAIAETQAAMILARQFPRNEGAARDAILSDCAELGLAEAGVYTYAKGGTEISDASIRLAEVMARHWGNIQYGIRELSQEGGASTMQAFAWDIERNVRQVREFQVEHERKARGSTYALEDPREIYELTANMGARRLRAAILGILPPDIKEAAVEACRATMTKGAESGDEAIEKILAAFAKFGVTKAMIEERLQRTIESAKPEQFTKLREIFNSLRDGMSAAGDWFNVAPPDDVSTNAASIAKARERAASLKKPENPTPPDTP